MPPYRRIKTRNMEKISELITEKFPPATLVPLEDRVRVYKEALVRVKAGDVNGLCLLLPMILWGLSDYLDYPDGEIWFWFDTVKMFPEITAHLLPIRSADRNKQEARILALKTILLELNKPQP